MQLRHVGYVGQNLTLEKTTGRTVRLANLHTHKLQDAIAANLADLAAILAWNVEHGIGAFRIGSSLIPFASHPSFDLDWQGRFAAELQEIADLVRGHGLRLSMHPGQYTVLNSPDEAVVTNAVRELEYHARVLELLDPEVGTFTLHVGGTYGDKTAATERFAANSRRLSGEAFARLTLENDDRSYGLAEVLELAEHLGRPVVYDHFHHLCLEPAVDPAEGPAQAMLRRVVRGWGDRVPKMHISSARQPGLTAHAEYVAAEDFAHFMKTLQPLGLEREFDVMFEAKAKERAVLRLVPQLRELGNSADR